VSRKIVCGPPLVHRRARGQCDVDRTPVQGLVAVAAEQCHIAVGRVLAAFLELLLETEITDAGQKRQSHPFSNAGDWLNLRF
jgi:hypothetical protein